MHHGFGNTLHSSTAVALMPGLTAGRSLRPKATGCKIGVIGFDNSIASQLAAHPLPGCGKVVGNTRADIAGNINISQGAPGFPGTSRDGRESARDLGGWQPIE